MFVAFDFFESKVEIEKIDIKPYTCKECMVEFSDMLYDTIANNKKVFICFYNPCKEFTK